MTIRLGASPLSWMNADLPSLGAHIAVEHCLSEMALIGFEGTEFEGPYLRIQEKLPTALKQRGLTCIGGWHSCHFLERDVNDELARIDEHIRLLKSLGASVLTLAECSGAVHQNEVGLSTRPKLSSEQWRTLCERLDMAAKRAKEQGMRPVYHHHMGTVVQSAEDIERLMQGCQDLELLFDTGHLAYAQEEWRPVFEAHKERIGHVHCKAVRSQKLQEHLAADSPFLSAVVDGVFTVPGDPDACVQSDFDSLIDGLKRSGYAGWIVLEAEQDPDKADPFHYATLGYQTLRQSLGA